MSRLRVVLKDSDKPAAPCAYECENCSWEDDVPKFDGVYNKGATKRPVRRRDEVKASAPGGQLATATFVPTRCFNRPINMEAQLAVQGPHLGKGG